MNVKCMYLYILYQLSYHKTEIKSMILLLKINYSNKFISKSFKIFLLTHSDNLSKKSIDNNIYCYIFFLKYSSENSYFIKNNLNRIPIFFMFI